MGVVMVVVRFCWVVFVVMVVVVGYWWCCGGDVVVVVTALVRARSCNSCRTAIVRCMLCGRGDGGRQNKKHPAHQE